MSTNANSETNKQAAGATAEASYATASNVDPSRIERVRKGEEIIHQNTLWSLGAGALPLPLFDFAAVTAVQLKMLRELSLLYGKQGFTDEIGKKIIASLIASIGTLEIGGFLATSATKLIPGLGSALGVVAGSATSAALTRAVGKVFLIHLESGGRVLDFDAAGLHSYFVKEYNEYKEAKSKVESVKVN